MVSYLEDKGWDIVALGRDESMLKELEGDKVSSIKFDLTQEYESFSELDPFGDRIWFHVAAAISGADSNVLDNVNIYGTEKLVQKAVDLEVPRFILVSSISTYSIDLEGQITEDADQDPESYYGQTKLKQEKIVANSNLDYSILRPPYIGGPYDENFFEEFGSRIEQGKMPTFGKDGIISYVDARDLAQALYLAAISDGASGESFNVLSQTISHKELVELMGNLMDANPPYGPHYPYWCAMIIGFFGEIWAKIRGKSSERGISRYRIKTLCREFELDPSKIKSRLGYAPQYTVKQSIIDWIETRS